MTGSRKDTVKGIDLLCEDMVSATYEQHREENVRIFKDCLLGITGCIFEGSIVKEDAFVTGYLRKRGGSEDFTKGFQLPLANAVALNSLYARANDFGRLFFFVNNNHIASHCSETLIPTGLTLASTKPITGREFIANDIAAEDLAARSSSMHEYLMRESIEEKFRSQCSVYGNISPKNVEKFIALDGELKSRLDVRECATLQE
ncbi:MAG: hypothetical protein WCR76_03370 [Sphaerochaetaceae bacterium]